MGTCPAHTDITVDRDLLTGELLGYHEVGSVFALFRVCMSVLCMYGTCPHLSSGVVFVHGINESRKRIRNFNPPQCLYLSRPKAAVQVHATKGASPNYFGKVNVILTLGGGGGGFRLVTFSDVLTKKNGSRTPTTFDINEVMRVGVIMKRQNDVIFSKIVWRCPLSQTNARRAVACA